MKLKDACVLDAVCCLPDISITAAARAMRQNHVGDLIVIDDADEEREPIGILTDRDIVVEVIAQGRDPDLVKVSDVMVKHPVIASTSEDTSTALERMRTHGVRRIPVVDEGGFVFGIITLNDLLRVHAEEGAVIAQVVGNSQRRESRTRR
jgi:CBS domain-containing protein